MNKTKKEIKSKKIVICIIARLESKRLPKKVVKKINNQTIIEHLITKLKKITYKNIELAICTTHQKEDDILEDIAIANNIHCIRGSVLSVVDRIIDAAELTQADIIVRVTGDNIFTDHILLEKLIIEHISEKADYSRIENIPIGVTAEVVNLETLKNCFEENNKDESEYMTLHLYQPDKYKVLVLVAKNSYSNINLSIDTANDFIRTVSIFNYLKDDYSITDIIDIIKKYNIPHSQVNETSSVKLIHKVIKYQEYKEYLLNLRKKSIIKTINI